MSSRHRRIYWGVLIAVLMLVGGVLFAEDSSDPYEIISPKINQNGDVIKEQHLLISLRLNQDIDALLTLTRIDEPKVVVASNEAAPRASVPEIMQRILRPHLAKSRAPPASSEYCKFDLCIVAYYA